MEICTVSEINGQRITQQYVAGNVPMQTKSVENQLNDLFLSNSFSSIRSLKRVKGLQKGLNKSAEK